MRHTTRWLLAAAMLALPAAAFAQATVTVNPADVGPVVTDQILGMNMANWFDQTQTGLAGFLQKGGIKALRWPGGSASDQFHWATNSECNGGYVDANASFQDFVNDVVTPGKFDVAITVNYGSNAACNAGGDPTEAAAWVSDALTNGVPVSHWTVGNEVYGSWEYDLHPVPHDPTTYAQAVATGFYPDMKTANPKTLVGVVAEPGWSPPWDPIVLTQAKYDFVEFHYYAQNPGSESDAYLVDKAPQAFAAQIAALKADLKSAGHADTPIYVGELGSVSYNPGKQTSSITQALYAGEILGELMKNGVSRATWWLGFGGCSDPTQGNWSNSLYGWQNFGGYMVWSDGTPEYGCSNATPTPLGTMLPTSRAFELFSLVANSGEHSLGVTLGGAHGNVRAYAASLDGGTAIVLFNVNKNLTAPVTISVTGVSSSSAVTVNTYDKRIYNYSKNNVWSPPSETKLGAQTLPLSLTLSPWSMNVVRLAK
jgi:hypothetical protein